MQNYTVQHECLMQQWIRKSAAVDGIRSFTKDGVIKPALWFSSTDSKERILFFLKEAYDSKNRIWDETKWISHKECTEICENGADCANCRATGMSFNPMAEWIYGIENIARGTEKDYDNWLGLPPDKHTESNYYSRRDQLLSTTAIVNIKKAGGTNHSSDEDLYYYAARDKELLIQQISLIQPTLLICGGTYGMLRCLFPDLPAIADSKHGISQLGNYNIIATCHPSKRCSNRKKYNNVMELYKELHRQPQF